MNIHDGQPPGKERERTKENPPAPKTSDPKPGTSKDQTDPPAIGLTPLRHPPRTQRRKPPPPISLSTSKVTSRQGRFG